MFNRFLVLVTLLALFVSGCGSPTETPDPNQVVLNDALTEAYRPYFPTATREFAIKHPLGYTKTPTLTVTATETPAPYFSPEPTFTPTLTHTPSPTREIYQNGTPVWPITCYDRGDIWVEVHGDDEASYTSKCVPVLRGNQDIFIEVYLDKDNNNGDNLNTVYLDGKGNYRFPNATSIMFTDFPRGHYTLWGVCDDKCEFKALFEDAQLGVYKLIDQVEFISYGNFCHEFDVLDFDYSNVKVSIDLTDDLGGASLFTAHYSYNKTCNEIADEDY